MNISLIVTTCALSKFTWLIIQWRVQIRLTAPLLFRLVSKYGAIKRAAQTEKKVRIRNTAALRGPIQTTYNSAQATSRDFSKWCSSNSVMSLSPTGFVRTACTALDCLESTEGFPL